MDEHVEAITPGLAAWEASPPRPGASSSPPSSSQDTWVDFDADRDPLLFIGGEEDHIMPPSVNRSNAKHYKNSPALTEYYELEGRDHWTSGAPGWEAVADKALEWALEHATPLR